MKMNMKILYGTMLFTVATIAASNADAEPEDTETLVVRHLEKEEVFRDDVQAAIADCNTKLFPNNASMIRDMTAESLLKDATKLTILPKDYDYDLNEKLLVICRAMLAHYNALSELLESAKRINNNIMGHDSYCIGYSNRELKAYYGKKKWNGAQINSFQEARMTNAWCRAGFTIEHKKTVVDLLEKRLNKVKQILRAFCHQKLYQDDMTFVTAGAKRWAVTKFFVKLGITLTLGIAPYMKRVPMFDKKTGTYLPMNKKHQILIQTGKVIGKSGMCLYDEWDNVSQPFKANDYDEHTETVMDKGLTGPRFSPAKGLEKLIVNLETSLRRCQTNELNTYERAKQFKTARFIKKIIMHERTLPRKGLKIDPDTIDKNNNKCWWPKGLEMNRETGKNENYVKRFVFVANPGATTANGIHQEIMDKAMATSCDATYMGMRCDATNNTDTRNKIDTSIVGVVQLDEFKQVWVTKKQRAKTLGFTKAHLKKFFKVFLNKGYDMTIYDITSPEGPDVHMPTEKWQEVPEIFNLLPVSLNLQPRSLRTKINGNYKGKKFNICDTVRVDAADAFGYTVTMQRKNKKTGKAEIIEERIGTDCLTQLQTVKLVEHIETAEWAQKLKVAEHLFELQAKGKSVAKVPKIELDAYIKALKIDARTSEKEKQINSTSKQPIKDIYELKGKPFKIAVRGLIYKKFGLRDEDYLSDKENVQVLKWLKTVSSDFKSCENSEQFDLCYNSALEKLFDDALSEWENNEKEKLTGKPADSGVLLAIAVARLYWRLKFDEVASMVLSKSGSDLYKHLGDGRTIKKNYDFRSGTVGALWSKMAKATYRSKFDELKILVPSAEDIKMYAGHQMNGVHQILSEYHAKMTTVGNSAISLERFEERASMESADLNGMYKESGKIDTSDDKPVFLSLSKASELVKFMRPLLHKLEYQPQFMCTAGESLVKTYIIKKNEDLALENVKKIEILEERVESLENKLRRGSAVQEEKQLENEIVEKPKPAKRISDGSLNSQAEGVESTNPSKVSNEGKTVPAKVPRKPSIRDSFKMSSEPPKEFRKRSKPRNHKNNKSDSSAMSSEPPAKEPSKPSKVRKQSRNHDSRPCDSSQMQGLLDQDLVKYKKTRGWVTPEYGHNLFKIHQEITVYENNVEDGKVKVKGKVDGKWESQRIRPDEYTTRPGYKRNRSHSKKSVSASSEVNNHRRQRRQRSPQQRLAESSESGYAIGTRRVRSRGGSRGSRDGSRDSRGDSHDPRAAHGRFASLKNKQSLGPLKEGSADGW